MRNEGMAEITMAIGRTRVLYLDPGPIDTRCIRHKTI